MHALKYTFILLTHSFLAYFSIQMYFRMFVLYQNRSITEATTAEAIPKCIVLQYV